MRLYIVRHGEAERRAATDAERALTPQGRHRVAALWQALSAEGVKPGRLVSSPYVRARQTAETIAGVVGDASLDTLDLLVPEGAPTAVLDWLMAAAPGDEDLVLVSHMPLVGQLTGLLADSAGAHVPFSVGTVACLEVEVAAAGGARLLWLRAPETGPALR